MAIISCPLFKLKYVQNIEDQSRQLESKPVAMCPLLREEWEIIRQMHINLSSPSCTTGVKQDIASEAHLGVLLESS